MKRVTILVAVLVTVALLCMQVQAARKSWTLDFKHKGLHHVRVGAETVAYMYFQVTNNTGADRKFFPIFVVNTDTRQRTYALPNARALAIIQKKHRARFLDIDQVSGTIKEGETKVGVAIFHKLDPEADHVKLDITGITDTYRYRDEDNRKGFLRRVWYVHWYRPGDAIGRENDRIETKFDDWVWRDVGAAETAPTD